MSIPLPVIDGVLGLGTALIERLFPDKTKQDEAKLRLLELQQAGALAELQATTSLALKQGDVNLEEAKNASVFVSGWRPFVGWVCGFAFFAKFLGGPLVFVVGQYTGHPIVLPPIDLMEMLPVLLGMLGLGGLRTYERINGKA
jgi:hypothetical protein